MTCIRGSRLFPPFDKIGNDSSTLNKYGSLNILDMRISSG